MNKFISITLLFCFSVLLFSTNSAQAQVGQTFRLAEGFVRIAEPGQISDTLSVWGDINAPGRYIVPRGTKPHELISYARGPVASRTAGQRLDWSKVRIEISISRYDDASGEETSQTFTFRYNEPYPAELRDFSLRSDDIISFEVLRRPAFVDWLSVISSVLGATATTIIILDRLAD